MVLGPEKGLAVQYFLILRHDGSFSLGAAKDPIGHRLAVVCTCISSSNWPTSLGCPIITTLRMRAFGS